MREIKFRAWDINKKEMFDPEYLDSEGGIYYQEANDECNPFLKEGDFDLMQYTGLKDKNGKEIYEGDIYTHGDKNIKYKVIFNNGSFVGNQIANKSLAGLGYWIDVIEIIGNVHEDPELLK